ncbi:MAG TPA: DUF1330 domain-containing protein [Gemmatimonadales bacterium]|nr:DUF1330 domain-containing protein [Gemmatimonadales bacterium]
MPAYIVVQIEVKDPVAYDEYKGLAPPSIEAYGGKYIVRGGEVETLEGSWMPRRFVVLEFPDTSKARAWWASTEYAEAKALRQRAAVCEMILVAGLPEGVRA